MARPHRILITGSRSWNDRRKINVEITRYISENAEMGVDGSGMPVDWITDGWVIVHGACPTGADALADDIAVGHWIEQEPHPANWKDGKQAGFVRNAEMVKAGADVCLAFINPCVKKNCWKRGPHGSHGATHCADLAESAGIEVRRFSG